MQMLAENELLGLKKRERMPHDQAGDGVGLCVVPRNTSAALESSALDACLAADGRRSKANCDMRRHVRGLAKRA